MTFELPDTHFILRRCQTCTRGDRAGGCPTGRRPTDPISCVAGPKLQSY